MLYSGKVCWDELGRIKRLARLDCLKLPEFLKDIEKYKKTLRYIAVINGLRERKTPIPSQVGLPARRSKKKSNFCGRSVSVAKQLSNATQRRGRKSSSASAYSRRTPVQGDTPPSEGTPTSCAVLIDSAENLDEIDTKLQEVVCLDRKSAADLSSIGKDGDDDWNRQRIRLLDRPKSANNRLNKTKSSAKSQDQSSYPTDFGMLSRGNIYD